MSESAWKLALQPLDSIVPTEEIARIYALAHVEAPFQCPKRKCKGAGYVGRKTSWFLTCKKCRNTYSPFRDSPIDGSHMPVRTWLQAAYLLVAARPAPSTRQLQKFLGISSRTTVVRMVHAILDAIRIDTWLAGDGIVYVLKFLLSKKRSATKSEIWMAAVFDRPKDKGKITRKELRRVMLSAPTADVLSWLSSVADSNSEWHVSKRFTEEFSLADFKYYEMNDVQVFDPKMLSDVVIGLGKEVNSRLKDRAVTKQNLKSQLSFVERTFWGLETDIQRVETILSGLVNPPGSGGKLRH